MKNLIVRSLTGVLFVAVLTASLLFSESMVVLFTAITVATILEFVSLMNNYTDEAELNGFTCAFGGAFLFLGMYAVCSDLCSGIMAFAPYLVILITIFVVELYFQKYNPLVSLAYTTLSQLYIALPFSLLNVLAFSTNNFNHVYNAALPLSIFVFLWASDTGAYCVGSLIGRHKLFPRISPGKTWEGSIGGGILCIGVALAIIAFGPRETVGIYGAQRALFEDFTTIYGLLPWQWVGLAVVVCIFGTWGDLIESLIKRTLDIKDSGNILPGHGGLLDRFDSSLMAIPAAVLYLYIVETISFLYL